ncbi:hypothetical protein RJT34_18515 [Clitoria ternatea]|uniref:Uncharacterized protein n=1 Tax=Clitoria ternatea TaxID=43366 RepID=A0AAN9JC92_CLITE
MFKSLSLSTQICTGLKVDAAGAEMTKRKEGSEAEAFCLGKMDIDMAFLLLMQMCRLDVEIKRVDVSAVRRGMERVLRDEVGRSHTGPHHGRQFLSHVYAR